MRQEILLLDMKKNEIGRLRMEGNRLKLTVLENASHLEHDLERLLQLMNQSGSFDVRKAVEQDGAVLEVKEKVFAGQPGYMGAAADFINRSKLRSPRIFAILRQIPGGDA